MPRTKKPAGTAVDPRNGRRTEIGAATLEKFYLPPRKPNWLPETRTAWLSLWKDPVAAVLSPVDRPVLLRWADSMERAARALVKADANPVGTGSMGQPVESPFYGIADKAIKVAQACEAQLGVGALHRAKLGLTITEARKSLADLNSRYSPAAGGDDDDDDPRARAIPGTVVG